MKGRNAGKKGGYVAASRRNGFACFSNARIRCGVTGNCLMAPGMPIAGDAG